MVHLEFDEMTHVWLPKTTLKGKEVLIWYSRYCQLTEGLEDCLERSTEREP